MKKIYLKLAASVLSIMMALTMIIGATYAWFSLSSSPEVRGLSVVIGGGKTILLAADQTKTVDGKIVHYPGEFSNTLNISESETYEYLNEAAGLSPVSTSDGLYWMLPVYDEETGILKDIRQFSVDETLKNANEKTTEGGHYIYLDFWMVSPGKEYNVRMSTDIKSNTGSYLIELPEAQEDAEGKLYLADAPGIMESIARVGFLVNTEEASSENMASYVSENGDKTPYKTLLGVYQEKGDKVDLNKQYQFTIYEPNADKHPSETLSDGDYIITKPLSYNPYGTSITEKKDISDQLMVQCANTWKSWNSGSKLAQVFQGAVISKENLTVDTATEVFYSEYLKGQIASYVTCGNFYKNTADLYAAAQNGVVSGASTTQQTAGATDDVVITTLPADKPLRVRMYIWLEGQDADCTNDASVEAASLALNIELSGADQ